MSEELKRLKKIKERNYFDGDHYVSRESVDKAIQKEKDKIAKSINALAWLLVMFIIGPLALMQLGISPDYAFGACLTIGGIIACIILPKITGRHY